jgi:hypothetical protein
MGGNVFVHPALNTNLEVGFVSANTNPILERRYTANESQEQSQCRSLVLGHLVFRTQ